MNRLGFISANNYRHPYPVYPIGVSYLLSYLGSHIADLESDMFDFNIDGGYAELERWCSEGAFDVVAVSLRNVDDTDISSQNDFINHYERTVECVRRTSGARIVIGGPGYSIFPKPLFERLGADFGLWGEGEESLRQLLELLFNGGDWKDVEGLVYRDDRGRTVVNGKKNYVTAPCLEMDASAASYYYEKSGMLNVQTKRGCPFGCIYCTYPLVDGRKVRTLDVSSVIDNIERMNRSFGADYLFFTDSVFNLDREYNELLCNRIIESGVKLRWGAYFTPRNLSEKDLALYKKAGLTHIEWGTDTLADETLEAYDKGFTWEDVRKTSSWASDLGIFYAHFMILGGWRETEATLEQTFTRCTDLGLTVFFPYVGMRVYPGTRLYDIALSEGKVKEDDDFLRPVYYLSDAIDASTLKSRAHATGRKWVFQDENDSPVIDRLRGRHRRGPLWEYLRY